MDLTTLLIIASAITILVTAFIEVVKRTTKIAARYLPITSIVVGIFVAIIVTPFADYDYYTMVVAGAIAGLSACGLFDLTKVAKEDK
ncbi:hypothetical protein H9635_09955 [Solibacillus sp. A46]|uniref:Holin n=1 Tax=Solibacillus faecavium TaxID=2762221 RepID=A0ABR8XYQ6_9BACL|nr:holin [Solibacillus faecavium]MBD8037068.1 hypothetical protein [Solibacillus faecavium]